MHFIKTKKSLSERKAFFIEKFQKYVIINSVREY